ncbi:hypothetical protein L1887_21040 [Cichorium endivia]|nr:hypothetical protein L1887_21040 [Cichorium endivia]
MYATCKRRTEKFRAPWIKEDEKGVVMHVSLEEHVRPEALDIEESIKKNKHIYIQRIDIEREKKKGTHLAKSFFEDLDRQKKRSVLFLVLCV